MQRFFIRVAWGRALALHCIDSLLREAGRYVAANDWDAKCLRALEIVRKHGPISESQMIKRGFKFPERERREILATLVAGKDVLRTSHGGGPGKGQPTIRYSLNFQESEASIAETSD